VAGAAGGLVYAVLARPLRRVSGIGPYVAGIVTVAGYFGSLLLALPLIIGNTITYDTSVFFGFGVATLLFGLMLGQFFGSWSRADGGAT